MASGAGDMYELRQGNYEKIAGIISKVVQAQTDISSILIHL